MTNHGISVMCQKCHNTMPGLHQPLVAMTIIKLSFIKQSFLDFRFHEGKVKVQNVLIVFSLDALPLFIDRPLYTTDYITCHRKLNFIISCVFYDGLGAFVKCQYNYWKFRTVYSFNTSWDIITYAMYTNTFCHTTCF